MNKEQRNNAIIVLLILAISTLAVWRFATFIDNYSKEKQAIERGLARYNPTNSVFEWIK